MTTTTIDGVRSPHQAMSGGRRPTPIWGLPVATRPARQGPDGGAHGPVQVVEDDRLVGDSVPVVRPSAHSARMLRVVTAATESGEATRGRPPPVSAGLVVAAQWAFFAAAALNLVIW